MLRSGEVEPVEAHDFVPSGNEVIHELRVAVVARVHLSEGSQLRVGAEYEIGGSAGPAHFACLARTALKHAF